MDLDILYLKPDMIGPIVNQLTYKYFTGRIINT